MPSRTKTGDIAKRLDVSPPTIRDWTGIYAEFMSTSALGRGKGAPRKFTETDLVILATIADGREKGLTHDQIKGILQKGQRVDTVPEMPSGDVLAAREAVQLIPKAELDRALDMARSLQDERDRLLGELDRSRHERDTALDKWQTDTSKLHAEIARLTGERDTARGQLSERQPLRFWLFLVGIIVMIIILSAVAVIFFLVQSGA